MSIQKVKKPVYDILTQTDNYPLVDLSGVAIQNDGNDTVTVIISDGLNDIIVNCTTNGRSYNADFKTIKSINVTAGTLFQIELRSVL